MRITHLTVVHPTFDSRIFHKECVSLVRAGFEVSLVAVADRSGVFDGVRVIALDQPRSRWSRLLRTGPQLLRKALAERADVYHFHDPELLWVGLALRLTGRKVVYDVHEDVPRTLETKAYIPAVLRPILVRVLGLIHRLAETTLSGIIVVTPGVGEGFARPVLVRNFPKLSEFDVTPNPRSGGPAVAAYVGIIGNIRGFGVMADAIALVRNSGIDAQLRLAGRVHGDDVQDRLAVPTATSGLRYEGLLDRAGVASLLAEADMGLVVLSGDYQPYRTAYPIKLFEYMAAGIPVIASDFPVYREIVESSGCGLLVDPSDSAAVADAITTLISDPQRAREMGSRGRAAVEQRFNWESEIDSMCELYRTVTV